MGVWDIAESLIPAAVGGAFGGVPGAAYGLAAGIADRPRQRMELEKANADIAFKNIEVQRQYDRQLLDREQLQMQDRHWQALEGDLAQQMKVRDLQLQIERQKFDWSLRDDSRRQEYREQIKDPKLRQLYDDNFNKYWEHLENNFTDEASLDLAGVALRRYGFANEVNAREFAKRMGRKTVEAWIINEQKHQHEMQQIAGHQRTAGMNRYGPPIVSPEAGGFFISDRQSPQIIFKSFAELGATNPLMKDAERHKAEGEMRRRYEAEAKNATAGMPDYNAWLARPENALERGLLHRNITPQQYEEGLREVQRRREQDTAAGIQSLRKAWAEFRGYPLDRTGRLTNPQHAAEWQAYFATPEAKARLDGWVKYEAAGGDRRWQEIESGGRGEPSKAAPAARQPAAPRQLPTDPAARQQFIRDYMFGGSRAER